MTYRTIWSLGVAIGGSLVALAFFAGSPAQAAGNCPPGMEQVRLGKALSCVPSVGSATSKIDPGAVAIMKSNPDPSLNPRVRSLMKGEWSFLKVSAEEQRRDRIPAGDFCAAIFMTVDGAVIVGGPGGRYRGALLSFTGPDIPKPASPRLVQIKLTQAPDPAVSLSAYNYTDQKLGMGVLAVAVPTIENALDSMVDVQPFKLEANGRVVLELTWHGGFMARDKLRKCVNQKAAGDQS